MNGDTHARRASRRLAAATLLMGVVASCTAFAIADVAVGQTSVDQRFLAGLRERRLYELAAVFCRDQLARSEISEARRAELTAELVRIDAEHALQLPADQRGPWWERAHGTANDYSRSAGAGRYGVWVRVQDALVHLTEGEVARQEAEIARGDRGARFDLALTGLRAAIQAFESVEKELERAIPTAPATSKEGELTSDELFALRNQVRLYRAAALRNRGLCYPEGEDRIAALAIALEPLRDALTQLPADDRLSWRIRIEQMACLRLLGNLSDARREHAALSGADIPADLRAAVRAEAVRLALAERDPRRALELATIDVPPDGSPDLDLARLEGLIQLWQGETAAPNGPVESYRDQVLGLVKYMEQRHGAYWGRRAEQLLLRSAEGGAAPADVEILRRKADDLYLRNQWPESLVVYDEGAVAAAKAGASDDEFLCRARGARVAEKLGDLADARRRWHDLALTLRSHPQAASAHFESLQLAIRLARDDSNQLEAYRQALAEHLAEWPRSAHADLVRVWLGNLYRHERDWDRALQAYGAVAADSPRKVEAIDGALAIWRGKWHDLAPKNGIAATHVDEAMVFWDTVPRGTPGATAADIAAARLLLEFVPQRAADAELRLRRALADGSLDAKRQVDVRNLLIVALALQPERLADATDLVRQVSVATPNDVMEMLRQLAVQIGRLPEDRRRALAIMQLDLIQLSAVDSLTAEQRTEVERLRAQALVLADKLAEAVQVYSALVKANPRDGGLHLEYARAVEADAPNHGWQPALDQWRHLARLTRPRSDEWYEAKCGVARSMAAMGQRADAIKVVEYILLSSAPVNGTHWDRAVRSLLDELKKKP